MIQLKHILVATDFGDAADTALTYARELARSFGAALHLVHVTDDLNARAAAAAGFPDYLGSLGRLQADVIATAEAGLAERLSDEDRSRLHAEAKVLTSPSPAAAIVDHARDIRADLIVTGTHGRGAMGHLFLGSVAERIVRSAPCPVLTVRHPQHEFVRPDALQKKT